MKKKTATTRYDVAEHLRTPEEMAAYLEACLEEADGDAAFIAKALGDLARAKGMTQVARDAGLSCVFRRTRSPVPARPDQLFRRDPITQSGRTRSPASARNWRSRSGAEKVEWAG